MVIEKKGLHSYNTSYLIGIFLLFLSCKVSAQRPVADFTASPLSGCAPLTVRFTDNSTGTPTKYSWDLGNGTVSGLKNPVTTYFKSGFYNITLTVSNTSGSNTIRKNQFIRIYDKPSPDFLVDDSSGCAPLATVFKDLSSTSAGSITSWEWDFGDGYISTEQNPSHSYLLDGDFSVTLKVINSGGCINSKSKRRYIKALKSPAAAFTFNNGVKCRPPETIAFNNLSTGTGTLNYQWDFGNGTTSNQINPSSTYNTGGTFSIQLIVADNQGCSDTLFQKDSLRVGSVQSLIGIADSVCIGSTTTLSNLSAPAPLSSVWQFGDSTSSTDSLPTKVWNRTGSYNIKLINTYASCVDSVIKTIKILALPVIKFSATDSGSCKFPFSPSFNDLTPNAIKWNWDFGNGSSDTIKNPSTVYNNLGTYPVALTVTSASGCSNTDTVTSFIRVLKPIARISNLPASGCIPFSFKPLANPFSTDGIASYAWDFGNGETSTSSNPTATYTTIGKFDIKLVITTNDGCTDSVLISNAVQTNIKPAIDFAVSPTSICIGSPVQFTDLSPDVTDKWIWSTGDGETSNQQNFQYIYKDTGNFTIRFIAFKQGCSDTVIKTNYVQALPPLAKFSITYDCAASSKIVFADSSILPKSWLWDFGDGNTDTQQNPVHTFLPNQSYLVTLTVTNGTCTNSITKIVPVNDLPPDFTVSKNNICFKDSVQFSATINNNARYTGYTWDFGDGSTVFTKTRNIFHSYSKTGNFTIKLITVDTLGCRDTTEKLSFINVFSPNANFSISTGSGCKPLTVLFSNSSATANGLNNIAFYIWTYNDGRSDTLTAPANNPVSHVYGDTGVFIPMLQIIDSAGCADSFKLSTPLIVSKPVANFNSASTNTCRIENIQLKNFSKGNNITSEWFFSDSTNSFDINPVKAFSANGNYSAKLVVTDVYGCKDSIERINYFHVQDVLPSFTINDSIGTCVPFEVTFKNQSQFALSQIWDFGDGGTSSALSPKHFYNEPGIYYATLTAKRNNVCFDTISKKIQVFAPTGTIQYNPVVGCAPLTTSFVVNSSTKVSYIYDYSDGTSIETTDSVTTHYYLEPGAFLPKVILKDSTGCLIPVFGEDTVRIFSSKVNFGADKSILCDSGSVAFIDSTFSGSSISFYTWNFGDGQTSPLENPVHFYGKPGLYTVALNIETIYGCKDSITQTNFIKTVVRPKASITGDTSFCGPSTVQLQALLLSTDTSTIQWHWQFGNGNSSALQNPPVQQYSTIGNFQVILTATNSSGCIDTEDVNVNINPFPTTNAGKDTVVCINTAASLHATGADVYEWQPVALLSCADCPNPQTVPLTNNTFFTLTGATDKGCRVSDTITVRVKKPFTITKPQPLDSICKGSSVQFNIAGAENYIWSPASGLSSFTIGNPVASPLTTTSYKVIGFDSSNCFKDSAFIDLRVFEIPTVNAGPDVRLAYGGSVTINSQNSADVVTWQWSPGQYLNCTNCPKPVATPEFNTTYTVTVTNNGGCTKTDQVQLLLTCDKSNLFLPTAFTPNNDNLNDVFYPMSKGVFKIKSLRIFNRNGELVFINASFSPNVSSAGWDGSYKGVTAPGGNYVYVIEVICNNNEVLSFSGNILLLK